MIAAIRFPDFYIGVEQADNPALAQRSYAVVSGGRNACVLACSALATQAGLREGQTLAAAQAALPGLGHINARFSRYSEVSRQLMAAMESISPQIEVVGLDEAYLDLTSCQSYYRYQPERIARLIRQSLAEVMPLPLDLGISGDKSTARWAAGQPTELGYTLIPPHDTQTALASVPLAGLCDLGEPLQAFLAEHGIVSCSDLQRLPASLLSQRFGTLGAQLWLMAQGKDPRPVNTAAARPQRLQAGKLLPPATRDAASVLFQLHQLSEKLAGDLQKQSGTSRSFAFALRCDQGWRQAYMEAAEPTSSGQQIFLLGRKFLRQQWLGETVLQLRIQVPDLPQLPGQTDIFPERRGHKAGLQATPL